MTWRLSVKGLRRGGQVKFEVLKRKAPDSDEYEALAVVRERCSCLVASFPLAQGEEGALLLQGSVTDPSLVVEGEELTWALETRSTEKDVKMADDTTLATRYQKQRDEWEARPALPRSWDVSIDRSSSLPNSNDTLCMLNRQRELTVSHSTAAPTAPSST